MTKRRVTPLFAVVLGISAPAAASTDTDTTASRPRTLPSGAPACGNTQSKKPRPCTTESTTEATARRDRDAERSRPVAAGTMVPRVLTTGAPACGNVDDKTVCVQPAPTASEIAVAAVREALRVRDTVRERLSRIGFAPVRGQVRDPAPTAPRQLRDGAPACGNVASRAPRRDCGGR